MKLNFPQSDDFKAILDSAIYWTQIDFNEESKKEVEGLLVADDIKQLTKIFSSRLSFLQSGIIQAKIGGGFNRVNFVTI
jgi:hypothetical protein